MNEAVSELINNSKPLTGELPAIIDLFSGCGGFGTGFDSAGFSIVAGVDYDAASSQTAGYNLHERYGERHGQHVADLTKITLAEIPLIASEVGYIVIGGPPCQAYSRAGRGKLRSLGGHHLDDPRGTLYEDYVRLCLEIGVEGVVMENVPESLNYGGVNIPETICEMFEREGYATGWSVLNAADYGVPQVRERMILMAMKKERCEEISFPAPTHMSILNLSTSWSARRKKFIDCNHFKLPLEQSGELKPWVTVQEALSDLPILFPLPTTKYMLLQPNITKPYKTSPANDFQRVMRQWYGEDYGVVSGNSFRNTVRDFPIFHRMKPGDDFRDVAKISEQMLEEDCLACGLVEPKHAAQRQMKRDRIVPPYDREKFHEKWKRLSPNKPAHTLPAHLGTDTYSHIHPWEPRGISVREAARLQSFPDDFLFQCSMSEAFKQIGNAVPPLLSRRISEHVKTFFI
jgi:DNA (cytosine-5)-methyltransferase 1